MKRPNTSSILGRKQHLVGLLFIILLTLAAPSAFPASSTTAPADPPFVQPGLRFFAKRDFQAAVRWFEGALKDNPNDPHIYAYIGAAYAELGLYKESAERFKLALELRPDDVNAQINLCRVVMKSKAFREALSACQIASEMDPSATSLNNLGSSEFELGRYNEARRTFQRVIAIDPNLAVAHQNLGAVYFSLHLTAQAVESALKAIELRPNYYEAWQSLGFYYNAIGSYRKGIAALEQSRRIKPDDAQTYCGLAFAWSALGKYGSALKAAKKATTIAPSLAAAHYDLAILSAVTGDQRVAFESRRKLEALDRNLADRLAKLLRTRFVTDVSDASTR